MMNRAVTTGELLAGLVEETGLLEEQCRLIVAKAVVVRHLAGHPDYRQRFVLKGGTCLHHVYGSPRASIADIDMSTVWAVQTRDLEEALHIQYENFEMDAKGRVRALEDDALGAEVPFTLSVRPTRRVSWRKERMKVSVVFRKTEVLDGAQKGEFSCAALSEPSRFLVQCSSLNEIAAEKFLGWAGRRLPKHFADLALIGRDHGSAINKTRVAELVRLKFLRERSNAFFWRQNLKTARDLRRSFANGYELERLGRQWPQTMGGEVFLTRQETARTDSIAHFETAQAMVMGFWEETLLSLEDGGLGLPSDQERSLQ